VKVGDRFDDPACVAPRVVHRANPLAANRAFRFQVLRRRAERFHHCCDQRVRRSRRNQPAALAIDKLGDARDCSRDHRPRHRQRFHQHHRQALGEAWQHEGTGARKCVADLCR
jgi:hypothetical protein